MFRLQNWPLNPSFSVIYAYYILIFPFRKRCFGALAWLEPIVYVHIWAPSRRYCGLDPFTPSNFLCLYIPYFFFFTEWEGYSCPPPPFSFPQEITFPPASAKVPPHFSVSRRADKSRVRVISISADGQSFSLCCFSQLAELRWVCFVEAVQDPQLPNAAF